MVVIVVFSFLAIILYNRFEILKLGGIINETSYARENIYKAHWHITKLATLGEYVFVWYKSDYNRYHSLRLKTDSFLLRIKSCCVNFVRSDQIDSLSISLETKEIHLFRMMTLVKSWEKTGSLLTCKLPSIVKNSVRMKNITRGKRGVAGLFGKNKLYKFLILQMIYKT